MSTKISGINAYIHEEAEQINTALSQILEPLDHTPESLKASMYYSLLAGGKRMRPILLLAAVESLNGDRNAALPAACAMEMIHTYSLIHDDLPAMDNDDYRRGKLTNHRKFDEATAILAGDGLLTHAFAILADSEAIDAHVRLKLVQELAWRSGPQGMVGGQAADMEGDQAITSLEQLEFIHRHKTGDLIVGSMRMGGMIAGANAQQLEALTVYGRSIGLAFQIKDDILDVVGDAAKLGKSTQSDDKSEKVTYPFFLGIEASIQLMNRYTEEGKQAIIAAGFPQPERLMELADYLTQRDH